MRARLWSTVVVVALLCAGGRSARADNNDCNSGMPTRHDFSPVATDVVQPKHLDVARPFPATGKLQLSVCNADLRVRARPGGHELRVIVNLGPDAGGHAAQEFVQALRVQGDQGTVELRLPKEAHATVTVEVPMGGGSKTEINLGKGNLEFEGIGASGDREINVGMGDARLAVGGAASYASLECNVGMGSFHDRRKGGESGHFAVSKTFEGSGQGSMEVNVGMGSLEIAE